MHKAVGFVVVGILLCAAAGWAQETAPPAMGPPAELKKLDWYIGDWTGNFKWLMEGMESESVMTVKNTWEGQFLKSSSSMMMQGMPITEVGYMAWDATHKEFVSWTFTNFGPMPRVERAKMTGDTFIFISDPWDLGPPMGTMTSRATITKKSSTEISFLLEFKEGDNWKKAAEGTFKKK